MRILRIWLAPRRPRSLRLRPGAALPRPQPILDQRQAGFDSQAQRFAPPARRRQPVHGRTRVRSQVHRRPPGKPSRSRSGLLSGFVSVGCPLSPSNRATFIKVWKKKEGDPKLPRVRYVQEFAGRHNVRELDTLAQDAACGRRHGRQAAPLQGPYGVSIPKVLGSVLVVAVWLFIPHKRRLQSLQACIKGSL